MDLKEFKEKHPEVYQEALAEFKSENQPAPADGSEKKFSDMQAKIDEQGKVIAAQGEQLKAYEKNEAIRAQKELAFTAEGIWRDALKEIPASLHPKIKKQVDFNQFVSEGVLDTDKFSEAVNTEIKDWEELSVQKTIHGFSTSPDDKFTEADARGDGLLAAAGQKPQK